MKAERSSVEGISPKIILFKKRDEKRFFDLKELRECRVFSGPNCGDSDSVGYPRQNAKKSSLGRAGCERRYRVGAFQSERVE